MIAFSSNRMRKIFLLPWQRWIPLENNFGRLSFSVSYKMSGRRPLIDYQFTKTLPKKLPKKIHTKKYLLLSSRSTAKTSHNSSSTHPPPFITSTNRSDRRKIHNRISQRKVSSPSATLISQGPPSCFFYEEWRPFSALSPSCSR